MEGETEATQMHNGINGHTEEPQSQPKPSGEDTYTAAFPSLGGSSTETKPKSFWSARKTGSLVGKTSVNKKLATTISATVNIPKSERRYNAKDVETARKAQKEMRDICAEVNRQTNCTITYSTNKDESLSVYVKGKTNADVSKASNMIRSKLAEQGKATLDIAKEFHRFILGRGGQNLRELESKTATKIKMPGTASPEISIEITGSAQGIAEAKREIQNTVRKQGARSVEKVEIPKDFHPWIFGPFKKTKEKIEAQCSVKVNIPPSNKPDTEISVVGEREACKLAVTMIMDIYNSKKDKVTTVNIDIDQRQHRYIVGPKMSGIHEMLEEFDVVVEVPERDSDSNTISLRGESMNMGLCLNQVYARAQSYSTNQVSAPKWLMKKLIGKKGETIKQLNPYNETENFVKVQFFDNEDRIDISGPIKFVDEVTNSIKQEIKKILSLTSHREIRIPQQYHGRIIGAKGANLAELRKDKPDLRIMVPDNATKSDIIVIEGSTQDVNGVFRELAMMAAEYENEKEAVVKMDPKYHKYFFLGEEGQDKGKRDEFNQLKERYPNVNIQFPPRDKVDDEVKFRGPSQFVDNAVKQVKVLYDEILKEHYIGNILIMKQYHKNVIGKGGATINRIKEDCNVQIEIPKNDDESQMIKVIGLKHNVERAKGQIREIESQLATISEAQVQINKSVYGQIIGQRGANIQKIRDEFEVAIQFPESDSTSDKVIIRGDREKVEQAKVKLLSLATSALENFYTEEIECPTEHRKFLVGKKGATRIDFQKRFDVALNIPERSGNIAIIGTEKNVKAARKELDVRIKELKNLVTKEVELDNKFFGRMIREGKIRDLIDEFGTRIDLPEQGSESNTVKAYGPKNTMDQVVAKLEQFNQNYQNEDSLQIELPTKDRKSLIGEKGATVNALQDEFQVRIAIQAKDNGEEEETTLATITGPRDVLEQVKDRLNSLVTYNKDYSLPEEFHGLLLGNKGATISDLSRQLHVTIKVPKKEDDNKNFIKLRGTEANLENAVKVLDERKLEWAGELEKIYLSSYEIKIEVPVVFHNKLIGLKGENIQRLSQTHNVRITLPKNAENNEEVTIRGTKEDAHAAAEEIDEFVTGLQNHVSKDVSIEHAVHNRIIGRRGRGIRRIMRLHEVEIKFPKSDAEGDALNLVTVSGQAEKVDAAIDELTNLETEFMQEDEGGDGEIDSQYVPKTPGQEALRDRKRFEENEAKNKRDQKNNNEEQVYTVSGAPWNQKQQTTENNEGNFPTLGGVAVASRNGRGAWGN